MYDLCIRNGMLVHSHCLSRADLYIEDGRIARLAAPGAAFAAAESVDADGLYVFPGGIDTHAHLNDPGFTWREDFAHGTAAAALGGLTTVIDMPLQNEPAVTTPDILARKQRVVAPKAYTDYALYGGVCKYNLEQLPALASAGVAAFKIFLAPVSPDYDTLSPGEARQALAALKGSGARVAFHCEEASIIRSAEAAARQSGRCGRADFLAARPLSAELIAVGSVLALAAELDAPVHICHISHPDAAALVRDAQRRGVDVTAETCPHYLLFNENDMLRQGALFKCAPPLRSAADRERLWQYLLDGTISCVASDHSPCAAAEKAETDGDFFAAWGGISGIEYLFPLMFDAIVSKRGLSPTLLARVLSRGPAHAFGLGDRKGLLQPGYDADLTLVDPSVAWRIDAAQTHQLNPLTAFHGLHVQGAVQHVLLRGQFIVRDRTLCADAGIGCWQKRADTRIENQ